MQHIQYCTFVSISLTNVLFDTYTIIFIFDDPLERATCSCQYIVDLPTRNVFITWITNELRNDPNRLHTAVDGNTFNSYTTNTNSPEILDNPSQSPSNPRGFGMKLFFVLLPTLKKNNTK